MTGRIAVLLVLITLAATPAAAQPPAAPPQPFAPQWAMLPGWELFGTKGCGGCHAVRGVGGVSGPDLATIQGPMSFFDIGAAMWNHQPKMSEQMRAARVQRPTLTPTEVSNLIAFVFTAQYFDATGDAKGGERLFTSKGCAHCHTVGGAGGRVGPELDRLKRANSPVLVAAAMWNHGPKMTEAMRAAGIARPTFAGNELADIIAYVTAAARDAGGDTQQVVPGTPARGAQTFEQKKCSTCHAVGGRGGRVGPDLGKAGHHISLTQLAARMWNHGPAMAAKMKERSLEVPVLSGQDFADLLAYLYVSRYFDETGSARRGQELVQAKGCLGCHTVGGKGGAGGGDFAKSGVVGTPAGLVAGMWNHAAYMEAQAEKRQVAWPVVTGKELGDVAAYLGSLHKRGARAPAAK
jgi:mono/diheme cytochrome c family protein